MVCLLGMRAARKAWQASNHKTTPRLSFCRSGSLHDAKKQVSREKQKLISKRGRFVPAASEEEEEENGEEGVRSNFEVQIVRVIILVTFELRGSTPSGNYFMTFELRGSTRSDNYFCRFEGRSQEA